MGCVRTSPPGANMCLHRDRIKYKSYCQGGGSGAVLAPEHPMTRHGMHDGKYIHTWEHWIRNAMTRSVWADTMGRYHDVGRHALKSTYHIIRYTQCNKTVVEAG